LIAIYGDLIYNLFLDKTLCRKRNYLYDGGFWAISNKKQDFPRGGKVSQARDAPYDINRMSKPRRQNHTRNQRKSADVNKKCAENADFTYTENRSAPK
jgi:hypothetical protein